MNVGKVLNELYLIVQEHPNIDVWCETDDYGPCVSYDPAQCIEDDEDFDGIYVHTSSKDGKCLKIEEVISSLEKFPVNREVIITDGLKAKPFFIKDTEEFKAKAGSQWKAAVDESIVTYPLVVFDC